MARRAAADNQQNLHTPASIVARLRAAVRGDSYDPPLLPGVALELMDISRDPDAEIVTVREMIEREPLLAARVMSIAQSAFYSRGNPVESLDDALVRLGVKRLAGIFMEAAMKASVLSCKAFERPLEQLRRHSTATAHIARGVCRSLSLPNGERAFLCGLLHDIGIAACLNVLGDLPRRERPRNFESIAEAVVAVHEEATLVIGEKWTLPWGIQWTIGHHHSFVIDGRPSPLAALTCLADWLAAEAGAASLHEVVEEAARQALDYFNFSVHAKNRLVDKCCHIVDQLP